jgi:hypothetical protein
MTIINVCNLFTPVVGPLIGIINKGSLIFFLELSRFVHIIETRAVQKINSFCSHSIIVLLFGWYFDCIIGLFFMKYFSKRSFSFLWYTIGMYIRKNFYRKCHFSRKIKICRKIIFVKRT